MSFVALIFSGGWLEVGEREPSGGRSRIRSPDRTGSERFGCQMVQRVSLIFDRKKRRAFNFHNVPLLKAHRKHSGNNLAYSRP